MKFLVFGFLILLLQILKVLLPPLIFLLFLTNYCAKFPNFESIFAKFLLKTLKLKVVIFELTPHIPLQVPLLVQINVETAVKGIVQGG